MGAMARIYLGARRHLTKIAGWAHARAPVDRRGGGRADQGPADPDVHRPDRARALDRRPVRALGLAAAPVVGIAWMLLLVLPWFVAIVVKSGDSFFVQAVGHDMLDKVIERAGGARCAARLSTRSVLGHILAGLRSWRRRGAGGLAARREPGARFLLAWLVPSWIVFEVVMTKLPHYVLPLYPAIAILIAGVLEAGRLAEVPLDGPRHGRMVLVSGRDRDRRSSSASSCSVASLGLLAWPFAAVAVILSLFAWWLYEVDGAERSLLRAMVASVFVAITVYAVDFPSVAGAVPERDDRRRRCAHTGCTDRTSPRHFLVPGAEPRFPRRHRHALHRRRRRGRIPARRRLPLRVGRSAQRAQLRRSAPTRSVCATR